MMPDSQRCQEVRVLLPEVAAGVASDDVRDEVLAHVSRCDECRRELERATDTVDELLLLAPAHEPPAGFDAQVLARLDPGGARHRRRWPLAAAAALLVAALGAGVTWWVTADDRNVADRYRETLATAHGSYMKAAPLDSNGTRAGYVFAYQGAPSWMFVFVENGPSGDHEVLAVTTDGRRVDIGHCTVEDGKGSWGRTIDVPVNAIDKVELVLDGEPTMVAALR
jgi:hypothetical protein